MSTHLSGTRRGRTSFKPAVESLESRWVPIVTVTQTPGSSLIAIAGTNQNDSIQITDNGLNSAGAIMITGNLAAGPFSSLAVAPGSVIQITIDMGRGNDSVIYIVTGSFNRGNPMPPPVGPLSPTGGRDIDVVLGRGRDTWNFGINNTQDNQQFPGNGFTIDNAFLDITVHGNQDNDKISTRYEGFVQNGRVTLVNSGDAGDDMVFIVEDIFGGPGASTFVQVFGGNGANELGLILEKNANFVNPPNPTPVPFSLSLAQVFGNMSSTAVVSTGIMPMGVRFRDTLFIN